MRLQLQPAGSKLGTHRQRCVPAAAAADRKYMRNKSESAPQALAPLLEASPSYSWLGVALERLDLDLQSRPATLLLPVLPLPANGSSAELAALLEGAAAQMPLDQLRAQVLPYILDTTQSVSERRNCLPGEPRVAVARSNWRA